MSDTERSILDQETTTAEEQIAEVIENGTIPAPAVQTRTKKQICIVGTTPSRMEGPINDDSWEIWTIGPGGKDLHRWNRLFEIHNVMHPWPLDFGELKDDKSYLDDLSRVEPPQIVHTIQPMHRAMEEWARTHGKSPDFLKENIRGDWKANVVLDREGLFDRHGRYWFTSSISYAIAVALEVGVTDLAVFGIDLESGEEYVAQHPGARHFLDAAEKYLGVNVILPKGCGLLRDPLPYPDRYETHMSLTLERKVAWLEAASRDVQAQHQEVLMMAHRVEGALMKVRQYHERLVKGEPLTVATLEEEIKAGEGELQNYIRHEHQGQANLNHLKGELSGLRFAQRMWVFGTVDPNFDLTVSPPN